MTTSAPSACAARAAAGDQVRRQDLPRPEVARQQHVQLAHHAEADDQHRRAVDRAGAVERLHHAGERLDQGAVVVGDCVGQTQRVAGEVDRRDAEELGHAAGIELRLLPGRALHELAARTGAAAEARRVMVDEDAIARAEPPRTPAPTATISPTGSWPKTSGAFLRMYQGTTSPEQMPQARARTSASPGPMAGTGISSIRTSRKS